MTTIRGYQPQASTVLQEGDDVFEVLPQELTQSEMDRAEDRDASRRDGRLSNALQKNGVVEDYEAFSARSAFVRLYRKVNSAEVEAVKVAKEFWPKYLKKRVQDQSSPFYGQPIFYTLDQVNRLGLTLFEPKSDPCPVELGMGRCGIRMRDQIELFKHITSKHRTVAPYYLSQTQLNQAQGLLISPNVTPISDTSSTPPVPVPLDATTPDVEMSPVEGTARIVPPKKPQVRYKTSEPHNHKSSFGRMVDGCPACTEIRAQKAQAVPA